jgi:hypothetical protein
MRVMGAARSSGRVGRVRAEGWFRRGGRLGQPAGGAARLTIGTSKKSSSPLARAAVNGLG